MISSTSNAKVKNIMNLKKSAKARKKEKCFLVEGPRMFFEIPKDRIEECYLTEEFEDNITKEITENVKRLRHHASLGLWCGNNEMESAWDHWPEVQSESKYLRADYIKMFEYIVPKARRSPIMTRRSLR